MNDLKSFSEETVIGKNQLSDIRDCLIYLIACNNMRRSQEFTTMTLGEYNNGFYRKSRSGTKYYIVLIKKHKTGAQGMAIAFLNEEEKQLVDRFLKFCRPGYTSCQKGSCPVF